MHRGIFQGIDLNPGWKHRKCAQGEKGIPLLRKGNIGQHINLTRGQQGHQAVPLILHILYLQVFLFRNIF